MNSIPHPVFDDDPRQTLPTAADSRRKQIFQKLAKLDTRDWKSDSLSLAAIALNLLRTDSRYRCWRLMDERLAICAICLN